MDKNKIGCWVLLDNIRDKLGDDPRKCYAYDPSASTYDNYEVTHNLIDSIYIEYEKKARKANIDVIDRENILIIDPNIPPGWLWGTVYSISSTAKKIIVPFDNMDCKPLSTGNYTNIFFLKSININNNNIAGFINIKNSIFFENVYFRSCSFEKGANFSRTIFCGQIDFEGSDFKGETSFFGSTFIGDVIFSFTSFKDKVYFTNAIFHGKLDLEKSNTTGGLWLQDIYLKSFIYTNGSSFAKLILEKINFFDKDPNTSIKFADYFKNLKKTSGFNDRLESLRFTFNLLKSTYTQNYNHIEANNFYALEMKTFNKELKWCKHFWQKIVFLISWATSIYGQSIFLPLFWLTMLFLAWLYFAKHSHYVTVKTAFDILFPIGFSFDNFESIKIEASLKIIILLVFGLSKAFSLVLYWNLGKAIKKNIRWG